MAQKKNNFLIWKEISVGCTLTAVFCRKRRVRMYPYWSGCHSWEFIRTTWMSFPGPHSYTEPYRRMLG